VFTPANFPARIACPLFVDYSRRFSTAGQNPKTRPKQPPELADQGGQRQTAREFLKATSSWNYPPAWDKGKYPDGKANHPAVNVSRPLAVANLNAKT
jgi:hypothetical protein